MLLALLVAGHLLDGGPKVQWTAPPACPTGAEVEARVRAALRGGSGVGLEADGVVTAPDGENGSWHLELTLRHPDGSTGHRRLTAPRCDDLGALAAFVIAVAASQEAADGAGKKPDESHLPRGGSRSEEADAPAEMSPTSEPEAAAIEAEGLAENPTRGPDEARETTGSASDDDRGSAIPLPPPPVAASGQSLSVAPKLSPTTPPPPSRASPTTPARSPRDRTTQFWASVEGAFAAGALPRVTGGVQGVVGPRWRFVELGIGASHWFARTLEEETVAASVQLTAGSVLVRGVVPTGRVTWGPEVALEVGGLRGEGVRGRSLRVAWNVWSAIALGATMAVSLDRARRWAFVARADLVAPFQRWTFRLDPVQVDRTGRIGVRAGVGVRVTLPPPRLQPR